MMLENVPLFGLTAPALLGIAVLLLLTGRIVPRSTLRDKDEECQRWQEAYEAEREARVVSDAQTAKLLEAVETNRDVVLALFNILKPRSQSGGSSDVAKKG